MRKYLLSLCFSALLFGCVANCLAAEARFRVFVLTDLNNEPDDAMSMVWFLTYLMEGDSPSFLYLVNNGPGNPEHPNWGSWGGRYWFSYNHRAWFYG